jgi:hypothetical protein
VTCRNLAELANTSVSNAASIIQAVKGSQIDTRNLRTMKEEMEHQLQQLLLPPTFEIRGRVLVSWRESRSNAHRILLDGRCLRQLQIL